MQAALNFMGGIASHPTLHHNYSKFSEILDQHSETYFAEALLFIEDVCSFLNCATHTQLPLKPLQWKCVLTAMILRQYFLTALQGEVEIVPVILWNLYSIEVFLECIQFSSVVLTLVGAVRREECFVAVHSVIRAGCTAADNRL